jgi:outer membrane protein assembly factor BamB
LRGAVAVQNARGENLVIACSMDTSPQGWILVTNIDTGQSRQVWVPPQYPNSPPYGSILASSGKFYTCEGPTFLEFDPNVGDWTFHSKDLTDDGLFIGVTEGPDGTIYFGGTPGTHLIAFDPKTRQLTDYGRMDPKEQYVYYLAVDSSGWVYCGIGSARENLVAFNPKTRARRQLIKEEDRQIGEVVVDPGADGKVYATTVQKQHYQLFEGQATPIEADAVAPRAPIHNINWAQMVREFPDGRYINQYNMVDKFVEIYDPKAGQAKRVALEYQADGTRMVFLTAGPGGKVYGASAFPCCILVYDPKTGGPMQRLGDLYWQSAAVSGTKIAAGRYAGGYLDLYDTAQPWKMVANEKLSNPQCVGHYEPDINVPVATVFHPDGRHVVTAGLPGYGYRGGGLAIYDMETGQSELFTHQELIPEQSIVSLRVLPDGNLMGGTSTHGGHGTESAPGEAQLVIFDWKTRKITFQSSVVPGATTIHNLELGRDGLVYGLTDNAMLFVFDPVTQQVVHRESLAGYGGLIVYPYNAMTRAADGNIYFVLSQTILRIQPGSTKPEKLADAPAPIYSGTAVVDGRVYFVCLSHLWSYGLPQEEPQP